MNIREYAEDRKINEAKAHRAANWALERTGREKGGSRKLGGTQLTPKEIDLCDQYLRESRPGFRPGRTSKKEKPYAESWQEWVTIWQEAIKAEIQKGENWERLDELLSVYGCICIAKDRTQLQMPVDGARLGDVALELCYSAGVDYHAADLFPLHWGGFTAYLISEGFESPGWGMI